VSLPSDYDVELWRERFWKVVLILLGIAMGYTVRWMTGCASYVEPGEPAYVVTEHDAG
jgi:hypothetical protein